MERLSKYYDNGVAYFELNNAKHTGRVADRLSAGEDALELIEEYNIPDLPTLEALLKANADGRVVVLPFKPEKGKTLIDVTEYVEPHPHPYWYEVDGSELTISFGKNGEPTYTLDFIDYTADAFGTVIFESEAEAWAALDKQKSNE